MASDEKLSPLDRERRLVLKRSHDLQLGEPVRIGPDPWGIAWCWGGVLGLRGNVVAKNPGGMSVKVLIRLPKRAAGRLVNVSPLLLKSLPSRRRLT